MSSSRLVLARFEMHFRNFVKGVSAAQRRPEGDGYNAELQSPSKDTPAVPGNRKRSHFVEYTGSNMG